jgi:hypothetical protein
MRDLFGPDVWVKRLAARIAEASVYDAFPPIVITDVRYLNEAEMLRRHHAMLIRIDRPGLGPADSHPSETELANFLFDHTITNDGTIDDLHRKIDDLMDEQR